MATASLPINDVIIDMLNTANGQEGYRALDLINKLDSDYQESDIQKGLAQLLTDGSIILTVDRKLKLK